MSKYDSLYYPVPQTAFEFAVNANLRQLRLTASQAGYGAIAAQVKLDQILAATGTEDREAHYRLAIESGLAPYQEQDFLEVATIVAQFGDTLSRLFRVHDLQIGKEKAYQALDEITYPASGDLSDLGEHVIKVLEVMVFTHYRIALHRFMGGGKGQDKQLFLYKPEEVDRRAITAYLGVERHYTIGTMQTLFKLCQDGYDLNK
jgi:hypothetical protein